MSDSNDPENFNDALAVAKQLHVLLVDDDPDFIDFVAKELSESYGHQTTVARNGPEAVKLLENSTGRFDMILLDYSMKEMDGLEVLRWMRDREVETPVIMLTSVGSEEVAVEAMKLGAYDYVRKEQIDLLHLELLVRATHERHHFRVAKAMEEENIRENGLSDEATAQMRDVVNAISRTIHASFSNIAREIEKGEARANKASGPERASVQLVLKDLRRQMNVLESGLTGLLKLYELVHAHHAWKDEIQQIKQEFMKKSERSGQQ